MILQHIVIPHISDPKILFLRKEGIISFENGKIGLKKEAKIRFNTYFGSFCLDKWLRYTDIEDVSLHIETEGVFLLEVFCRRSDGQEDSVLSTEISNVSDFLLREQKSGTLYFSLTAKTDGYFLSADYRTEKSASRDVNLCAVICTYKREPFVRRNVAAFHSLIDGDLKNHLLVMVVDNGNTLSLSDKSILLLPNKNAGGAGGFTRGLIEIMKIREQQKLTHVILMDDDVSFDPETFYRAYGFLSYLKDEFSDAFISGGMFRLDQPTIQSENSDFWDFSCGGVLPRKHNFDLSDFDQVVQNEIEEPINYSSWWYCVMPATLPREDNLPLPLFIKRDDVEYGLRNGKTFITLNGIAVWHEPFEKKRPASLEYYYIRNRMIMDFSLGKAMPQKYYSRYLLRETLLSCLRFRYNEAESLLSGAEDFCKGISWLKTVDPTKKNDEIRQYNAVLFSIDDEELAACSPTKQPKGEMGKLLRLLTANGWLLPAKKTISVRLVRPSYKLFFGAKRALNYDPETKTGYYTERKYSSVWAIIKKYLRVRRIFSQKYETLLSDYKDHTEELRSLTFWEEYLG